MRARLLALLPLLLASSACGNHIVHQSRYLPKSTQMEWDKDYLQLPWQPPALGELHYERKGKPAKAQYAAEIDYHMDVGPDGQLKGIYGESGALDDE